MRIFLFLAIVLALIGCEREQTFDERRSEAFSGCVKKYNAQKKHIAKLEDEIADLRGEPRKVRDIHGYED